MMSVLNTFLTYIVHYVLQCMLNYAVLKLVIYLVLYIVVLFTIISRIFRLIIDVKLTDLPQTLDAFDKTDKYYKPRQE